MLQQTLSNLLGLIIPALVQEAADQEEGSVPVLVLGVNDQVVLRVSAPRVKDKLDHLDNVWYPVTVTENQVERRTAQIYREKQH